MAKKTQLPLPRLSRIDFFRLRADDFFEALHDALQSAVDTGVGMSWNEQQRGVVGWRNFRADLTNGGLSQYFYNHTDEFVPATVSLLETAGMAPLATLLKQAVPIYRKYRGEFDVANPFGSDGLFARMTELASLDRPADRLLARADKAVEKWVRANIDGIVVGDDGEPIDPKASGEIVTCHPSGNVSEVATIRKGKLSGPYHRYFPDGTPEFSCYYEYGEISEDYWPSGQVKHKTVKRGKQTVEEWYYPSGNVHKRLVMDKELFQAEPIRVWHDNGQLAEEVHFKEDNLFGPWLQFFEDGTPRSEAEHGKNRSLIVHNAWDNHRKRVVKNGAGVFVDDGVDFKITYDLVGRSSDSSRTELKNGIPHGTCTRTKNGVVWCEEEFAHGLRHGQRKTYYDNGRLESTCDFVKGKAGKRREFPKFDHPIPVVLLKIQANAELSEGWNQPILDVYPIAKNLQKIQAKLELPAFLVEVFERNKAGKPKEDYDDWNRFNDGVTYLVVVNERGTVDRVEFSGASAYSGAVIDIYINAIRLLNFEPGRIGKRKIHCQVAVGVQHTFVEGGR